MEADPVLMPLKRPALSSPPSVRTCRLLAALLILGAAALHLAYLAYLSPVDLAPDEAHYWDWSRHLDWSYYSKGPLVAWLIRTSCGIVGRWSESATGSLALAVRLPAVVCGSLLLASVYVLTVQVFGNDRLALGVVAAGLTLPLVAAASSIMTIDAPYTCLWGWALVAGHRAIFRDSLGAWVVTGLLVGLGILAKYTAVLWIPSAGLFLLATPGFRRQLLRPGFWVMTATAALCCLPILIWNLQHDWVTFRHVFALAGLAERTKAPTPINWLGPLIYLGGQCALLLVFWFFVWLPAMIAHRPTVEPDPGVCYLWWLSAPMFLLFLAFSPKTDGGEVNWPVTAYVSGLVLGAAWLARQFQSPNCPWRLWTRASTGVTLAVGLALTVGLHFTSALWPVLAPLAGKPSRTNAHPIRKVDPTCRLRGWRWLGREVDRVRAEVCTREGAEPILAGDSWTLPGELGVYCAGHPQAYSVGLVLGDRHSQYDLWENPLDNPDRFRGKTFVLVGGLNEAVRSAFDHIGPTRHLRYYEKGQPVSTWTVTVCRGFKGFPRKAGGKGY
jgi:4-amino-4-deoxy-L-arabinose transferase-like glycosyltransferase